MFEFPLVESKYEISINEIKLSSEFNEIIRSKNHHLTKFNQIPIIHKLTHQNLYTTFWIIDTNERINNTVLWENISNYAVPTLIQNFVDKYRMNT